MALETLRNEITNVESTQIRGLLELFVNLLEQKNEEVITLKNQVQNLEERVLEMEKYSSKDCLIIDNMPLGHGKVTLEEQVCAFLKQYLNYQSNPSNFKACHFLGKYEKGKKQPPIIVKFVYFGEKAEIFGRKSWLAGKPNPFNGRSIYLRERLPLHQRLIKEKAEEYDLITTTQNCEVKVFTNTDGKFTSKAVKSIRAIEDIKNVAVKRASKKRKPHTPSTPIVKNDDALKSVLKRIRESPNEAQSLALLKQIRMDTEQLEDESNLPVKLT